MGRMAEHYIEVMNMNDMDGWNQFEQDTHERLCELIASLQQYMTTEDLSLLCWATGVSKTHIASKLEIEQ